MVAGMIVSESRGSGAAVIATETFAAPDTTLPSGLLSTAVIVVEPALRPVMSPEALTEAIDGELDCQAIWVDAVTSCWRPVLPEVASAISWLVWPDADSVCEAGVTETETYCSLAPPVTVKVPLPV